MIIAINGNSAEGLEKVKDILIERFLLLEIKKLAEAECQHTDNVIEGSFDSSSAFNWYICDGENVEYLSRTSVWINYTDLADRIEEIVGKALDLCSGKYLEDMQ